MEQILDGSRPMMAPRRPLDPGSLPGATPDEVLRGFVASVRGWRAPSTVPLAFRREDLVVLVAVLGTDAATIERRLVALTGCDRRTARRFRRLLLVSLAALPLTAALPAVSAPAGVQAAPSAISAEPEEARAVPVAASASPPPAPAPPAVPAAVAPPEVASTPASAPLAASAPAPELQGADGTVSIARLGMDLPVVHGGQDVIDRGVVAHYWAPGWREPAAAGAPGTYWLAAHRQTHGAPFARLPEVVVGDRIDITTAGGAFTYVVTSLEVVTDDAGFGPVYGDDPDASLILLQTCLDDVLRLLVHGTLVPAR
jgi:LPXTG-site transpeptidase (sortase) family protein